MSVIYMVVSVKDRPLYIGKGGRKADCVPDFINLFVFGKCRLFARCADDISVNA